MPLVGPYDAATFVLGNYATYPQLPAGVTYYQPSMWWSVTGAGTVQGQPVDIGDLLFATQGIGRLYGRNLYGDQIFGGESDGNWTVEQVYFLAWDASLPGPIQPPYPNAGCKFTRDDLPWGDWAPGWRIVVDAYYNNLLGTRVYGEGSYGGEVYGDADNDGVPSWVDITQPSYAITAGDGTRDGSQSVPVAELVVSFVDEAGIWFDFGEPWIWYQPQPGTSLRIGLIDPQYRYWPVCVGQIERVEDIHDGDHPRVVSVRAFSNIMDLTVDVIGWQRPAESVTNRFQALVAAAGWRWGEVSLSFPGDGPLIADLSSTDIVVRDEIDRTAQSVGWQFDADRNSMMRLRTWPLEPVGPPLHIVDCEDDAEGDGLVSASIVFANDQSQLLNYVIVANLGDPRVEVRGADDLSVGRFGYRGRSLGYPKTGLAFADTTVTAQWVRRVANRFANITRHVEQVDVDTGRDRDWLAVLAELDTGRAAHIERRGIRPFTIDAVIVGWEHNITPGRWQSQLYTSTTTPSY